MATTVDTTTGPAPATAATSANRPALAPAPMRDMGGTFNSTTNKLGGSALGFSGCDVSAVIRLPAYARGGTILNQDKVFRIGTVQTISISTYNSKTPVKALGFKNPVAVARGGRTIAGTLIFNQLHTHVFNDNDSNSDKSILDAGGFLTYASGSPEYIYEKLSSNRDVPTNLEKNRKTWDFSWDTNYRGMMMKPSDLPPFDIIINMLNESGQMGKIILENVEIIHDSTTLSVEDIYTEVQYQYMARDIKYFEGNLWGQSPELEIQAKSSDVGLETAPAEPNVKLNRDLGRYQDAGDSLLTENYDFEAFAQREREFGKSLSPAPAASSSRTPEQRKALADTLKKIADRTNARPPVTGTPAPLRSEP
jgi:hypothetical protein